MSDISLKNVEKITKKGPLYDPGLCRCCGVTKKCRLINYEYAWMGQKEVYTDIFMDCFGLVLSHLEGDPLDRLICATCVTRLREADMFRRQVLRCEQQLLQARIDTREPDFTELETMVKIEDLKAEPCGDVAWDDGGIDYGDDDPSEDYSVPVQEKRLEKRKKSSPKTRKNGKIKRKMETEEDSDKNEMLENLAVMGKRLRQMKQQGEAKEKPLKTKPKDSDYKEFSNTCTIIQNSYVCPFDTSYSDYYCFYCKQMFTEPIKLREHTLTHDPKEFKEIAATKKLIQVDILRIDCRLCTDRIDDLETFKYHITSVHGLEIHTAAKDFLKFNLTVGSHTCLECGSVFSFFHALKKHMAEHFGTYICDVCGAHYFVQRMLLLHQKSHQKNEEIYNCDECGKVFKNRHNRNIHVSVTHKKEPAHECYKCDKVFFSYHLRYRHLIEVHGEERMFPCQRCDRVYDSRKSLREHNRRIHLKLLKHQCDLCDKRFYLPSRLREHMASHTGERNFRCEYCGKSYPRLRGLKIHMQSHNAEKKFKCSLCNASFTQNVNLKNHIKKQHQTMDLFE